jgi:hypothetical protein
MLKKVPIDRISVDEALAHHWFEDIRKEKKTKIDTEMLQTIKNNSKATYLKKAI